MVVGAQVLTCLQKWREKDHAFADQLGASAGQVLAAIISAKFELAIKSDELQGSYVKSNEKDSSSETLYVGKGIEASLQPYPLA